MMHGIMNLQFNTEFYKIPLCSLAIITCPAIRSSIFPENQFHLYHGLRICLFPQGL